VQVQDGTLLFIETIADPTSCQTVMIRVVSLNSDLLPISTTATVEIADGKGNKIMKQDVTTDEFGMATLELPVSYEPNLGVWKVSARAGDTTTEIDVRIEKYVLPKYEVVAELEKPWFLIDEPIAAPSTPHTASANPSMAT
jgi:CD109 antigen